MLDCLTAQQGKAVVRSSCLAVVIYLDISWIFPKQGFWKSQLRRVQFERYNCWSTSPRLNHIHHQCGCFPHQCTGGSWTPSAFVRSCYRDRDDDDDDDDVDDDDDDDDNYHDGDDGDDDDDDDDDEDEDDDDDVAVLFKHALYSCVCVHQYVILKYCSGLSTAGPQVKRWQRIVIPLRRVLRVPIK